MSINLLCVRISNCSRAFLFTCGDLRTVNLFILVGKGTGPATLAPAFSTVCTIARELWSISSISKPRSRTRILSLAIISPEKQVPHVCVRDILKLLFDYLSNLTTSYSSTTFANSEAQPFLHSNWMNEFNINFYVVTGHYHLLIFRQCYVTGNIGCPEVKLRTIPIKERRVTTTLFLGQGVNLPLKLRMRSNTTRLRKNLSTNYIVFINTAQQCSNVIAGLPFVQYLVKHFNTGTGGFCCLTNTYYFDSIIHMNNTAFNTTGNNSTTTLNGKNIFDRHQKILVYRTFRLRKVVIHCIEQFLNTFGLFRILGIFHCFKSRAFDYRNIIAWKLIFFQQVPHLFLNQFDQIRIVYLVGFVNKYYQSRHTNLTSKQDMLFGLRHSTVGSCNNNNGSVHLCSTSDHIFDIVCVSRTVNVSVVPIVGFVLYVTSIDSYTTGFFFRCIVDLFIRHHLSAIAL